MKSGATSAAQILLAAGSISLLAALVLPWPESTLADMGPASFAAPAVNPPPVQGKPERATRQAIISLFVTSSAGPTGVPAARTPPAEPARKPVDAPWLKYIGSYSGAPRQPCYLLKDTRTARMVQIPTSGVNAWTLVEVTANHLVVRHGDDLFVVSRRQP